MVTQRAELSSLITVISGTESTGKADTSLTGTFKSYISENAGSAKNGTDTGMIRKSKMKSEYNQKDAYDKVSTGTYSKNVDQMKSQMQKTESSEELNAEPENIVSQDTVNEVEAKIRDIIKEKMDMTDEEIDEVLAEMNISIFQLLQPEMLQEFVMLQTGAEPIDMITDSSLMDTLQTMKQEMTNILQEYEVTEPVAFVEALVNNEIQTIDNASKPSVSPENQMEEVPEDFESEVPVESAETEKKSKDDSEQMVTNDNEVTVKDEASGIQVTVENGNGKNRQTGHQSFEQQGQQLAGNVVNQLSEAIVEGNHAVTAYSSEIEQQDIVRQVVEQIKIMNGNETSRMQVQLYPEHLGRVEIQVMLKNGTMTAQITAETEMAKAAIESQLQILKESFEEKNIQVDAVEVSVGTKNFERDQDGHDTAEDKGKSGTGRRNVRLGGLDSSMDEISDEEAEERLEAHGASVEFSA